MISFSEPSLRCHCEYLAQHYDLSLFEFKALPESTPFLWLTPQGLHLCSAVEETSSAMMLDFSKGAFAYRLRHLRPKQELLAKAVGLKHPRPHVLDCTAGFGKDGVLLASCGFSVTMLEKNLTLYLLLRDGLQRYQQTTHPQPKPIELNFMNAVDFLRNDHAEFAVIYLDPMFPKSPKSALVKKPMQILQTLVQEEKTEYDQLFKLAMDKATQRVVVKRPLHGESLAHASPDWVYKGKAIRYDVFNAQ